MDTARMHRNLRHIPEDLHQRRQRNRHDCRSSVVKHLDAVMRKACGELGVERATPHDLRRTHGSTITALKFGRDAMNRIQNHREGGIADVYDRHEYADENRNIMEAVAADIIMRATGAVPDNVIAIGGGRRRKKSSS